MAASDDEGYDILISPDGDISYIYADDLRDLQDIGEAVTTRASHVEPYGDGWTADMRPSGGPVLFVNGEWDGGTWEVLAVPFARRADALAAEREWLRKERGL